MTVEEFAQVVASDIADCKTCPLDCSDASYEECEKRLVMYAKEMMGEEE